MVIDHEDKHQKTAFNSNHSSLSIVFFVEGVGPGTLGLMDGFDVENNIINSFQVLYLA